MEEQNRLESWKQIGAYLQRDARTARRWEKEEGLPVHRHGHRRGSSVYAFPSEIDAWRAGLPPRSSGERENRTAAGWNSVPRVSRTSMEEVRIAGPSMADTSISISVDSQISV